MERPQDRHVKGLKLYTKTRIDFLNIVRVSELNIIASVFRKASRYNVGATPDRSPLVSDCRPIGLGECAFVCAFVYALLYVLSSWLVSCDTSCRVRNRLGHVIICTSFNSRDNLNQVHFKGVHGYIGNTWRGLDKNFNLKYDGEHLPQAYRRHGRLKVDTKLL